MERTIRKINAKKPKIPKRERVAAYARVSTASDEQMGNVEAQKDYFQKLITERLAGYW